METPSALIRSLRFPIEWGDKPDSTPPPGRQAAQALLDELLRRDSIKPVIRTVAEDYYEHSAWYFWFGWADAEFTVYVEASVTESSNMWWVSISRKVGLWRSLFGKRGESSRVPEGCLELLGASIRQVFDVNEVNWLSAKDASVRFWGAQESPC